jgi:Holliday junction DNA helicase RuvA
VNKSDTETGIPVPAGNTPEQDSLNALVALGIPRAAAETAVRKAMTASPEGLDLETIIKKALQLI